MAFNWGDPAINVAKKLRADLARKLQHGVITQAQYNAGIAEADRLTQVGQTKNAESKADRFKTGIARVGTVVVNTVGGLFTGGPVGAISAGITSLQGSNPIVDPQTAPGPTNPETGTEYTSDFWKSGHWVPFALIGAFIFRKRLTKLFR